MNHIRDILIDQRSELLSEKNFILEQIQGLEKRYNQYKIELADLIEKETQIQEYLDKIEKEEDTSAFSKGN